MLLSPSSSSSSFSTLALSALRSSCFSTSTSSILDSRTRLLSTPRLARPFTTPTTRTMLALTKFRPSPSSTSPQTPPKTLAAQPRLPRLPIPPLEQTLAKYLKSLEPILLQMQERGEIKDAQAELEKRKVWAEEMLDGDKGMASRLQRRLLDVDATTPFNWLDDRFWLQKAYHEWRVPLLINSNWWLLFTNDPSLQSGIDPASSGASSSSSQSVARTPFAEIREKTAKEGSKWDVGDLLGEKDWEHMQIGIRRAAWLAWRLVEFKMRLDRQDILPDASRAGPFCMHQYTNVFGVTRIPSLPHDWNTRASPDTTHLPEKQANKANPPSRHITVTVRNNYYELQVVEPSEGKIMRPEAIEEGLRAIVQDAKSREDGQGVGVLSSDERDTWTQSREHLLSISDVNRASVKSIETSLLAITLDTSVLPLPSDFPEPSSSASNLWVDALARNCSGAGRAGHNRWFDKSMTLVVEPNGRAGINGEHSPVDALIPSILADYATGVPCPPLGTPLPSSVDTTPEEMYSEAKAEWKRRDFEVDGKLQEEIDKSTNRALALSSDSDIRVLYYDEYGADWIKKVGKHSPDAYLQMALQVAMALTHTWQVPTYETASTRLFRNGRTDVIRTFSTESYAFVKALTRENVAEKEGKEGMKKLYKLLTAATVSHNSQTRESSLGRGIDRHLTGLRLVYNPVTDEQLGGMPKLLQDDLFGKSQTWTLSTSGLSAGDRLAGTGFGAGYPDGYGCNYLAGGQLLKFGLESKHSNPDTSTTVFSQNLVKALRLMRDVCEQGAEPVEGGEKGRL